MKKANILRAFIDARKTTLDLFYDFGDKTYKAAKTRRDVFLMLASYADADGKGAYPSMKTLADNCCIGEKQVGRIISWLEANGLLLVKHKGSKDGTNLYTVLIPGNLVTDIPTVVTDISRRFGSRGFRENGESERESKTKTAHALLELEDAAGQVLKEIARAGGTVTRKDSAAIHKLIADSDWTVAEIISATKAVLDKLDTWEMKQAGDRVSSSICCEIELKRESDAKLAANESLLQTETELARPGVERELQELESEVIETTL